MRALADLLANNHAKLAAFIFPLSIAGGFAYTSLHGTSALADARAALYGERSEKKLAARAPISQGFFGGGGGVIRAILDDDDDSAWRSPATPSLSPLSPASNTKPQSTGESAASRRPTPIEMKLKR